MKKIFLASIFAFLGLSIHANADTCTLGCRISEERILAQEAPPRDVAAFRSYCQSLGGGVTIQGSYMRCTRWHQYDQVKSGSGTNRYEAEILAKRACYAHGCRSGTCPSGIVMASAQITTATTCN